MLRQTHHYRRVLAVGSQSAQLFSMPVAASEWEFEVNLCSNEEVGRRVGQAFADGRAFGTVVLEAAVQEALEQIWQSDAAVQVVLLQDPAEEPPRSILGDSRVLLLRSPVQEWEVRQAVATLCEKRRLEQEASCREQEVEDLVEQRTEALRLLTEKDTLTGLANRGAFLEMLNRFIDRSEARTDKVALLFLDLDDFKMVNDSLGHVAGDLALFQVAERLQAGLNTPSMAPLSPFSARLGGDEFGVLLDGIRDEAHALTIAEQALEAVNWPIRLNGREFSINASVGVALLEGGQITSEEMVMRADNAMYESKGKGKNRVSAFTVEMQERVRYRIALESDLRRAISSNQLELHFQPVFNLQSMALQGHEALLRWRTDSGELRFPGEFVEVAEQCGLIAPIGRWVIEQACEFATYSSFATNNNDERYSVSVNVASQQLREPRFAEEVEAILKRVGTDPTLLNVEITESTFEDEADQVFETLSRLRELGVGVHLDDFGTGLSSLSFVHRYPIDALKIDRSIVSGQADHRDRIVEAILVIAKNAGISVIGEGIEDSHQLEYLRSLGCDHGQGYLLGRPLPAERLAASGDWTRRQTAGQPVLQTA